MNIIYFELYIRKPLDSKRKHYLFKSRAILKFGNLLANIN